MEKTWASGAIELLRHADSHIHLETAFDRRIAFISVDNSVETSIRTFLSLPQSKSGIKAPRKEIEAVENSFPGMLNLLWQHADARLTGIDESDIEHYHRIRNKLYHDGTGLSVDVEYLLAYRQIAVLLLKSFFGVDLGQPKPAPTLERLILLWNQVEQTLALKFGTARIDSSTFSPPLEEAIQAGQVTEDDMRTVRELREIRNNQVHSSAVDRTQVEHAVGLAEKMLANLNMHQTYNAPIFTRFADSLGHSELPAGTDTWFRYTNTELRPGDTVRLEVEVDSSFSPDDYTIKWMVPGGNETGTGDHFVLTLLPRHVRELLSINAIMNSKRDWHRHGDFDAMIRISYRVLPPLE
jgi:hypothetical protein